MKIYKIECEWDMGFQEFYKTKELAQKAIDETNWRELIEEGETVENLIEEGLLSIKEITI